MTISFDSARAYARVHWFALSMTALGVILIALAVFEAGIMVGYHEARFSYGLDRNYERTFGAPGMNGRMSPPTHGSAGQIVSIALPTITIESANNPEMLIRIGSSTIIRNQMDTLSSDKLSVGQQVIVLGEPDENEGEVDARLIRVLPATPAQATSTPKR